MKIQNNLALQTVVDKVDGIKAGHFLWINPKLLNDAYGNIESASKEIKERGCTLVTATKSSGLMSIVRKQY